MGVLKMIRMRLQAEMKTIGRDDLKLLAKLLQENDLEVRKKDCCGHFYRICLLLTFSSTFRQLMSAC